MKKPTTKKPLLFSLEGEGDSMYLSLEEKAGAGIAVKGLRREAPGLHLCIWLDAENKPLGIDISLTK